MTPPQNRENQIWELSQMFPKVRKDLGELATHLEKGYVNPEYLRTDNAERYSLNESLRSNIPIYERFNAAYGSIPNPPSKAIEANKNIAAIANSIAIQLEVKFEGANILNREAMDFWLKQRTAGGQR